MALSRQPLRKLPRCLIFNEATKTDLLPRKLAEAERAALILASFSFSSSSSTAIEAGAGAGAGVSERRKMAEGLSALGGLSGLAGS